jgi:spore coat polysaccharide biosynthesis predicted glycosyltransferase SpsG
LSRSSGGPESWRLAVSVHVGGNIGFGHLKRCIAVATHARSAGAQVDFHLAGDVASGGRVAKAAGFGCRAAAAHIERCVVLVDRVHRDILQNSELLELDIARWRKAGERVALIDGAGTDSLRHCWPGLTADLLIAPYAGERTTWHDSIPVLAGSAFAPLGSEYENSGYREINADAHRILLSCGGSDPFKITEKILAGFTLINDRDLALRVVLGPGFDAAYRDRLMATIMPTRHNIEWVDAPDSLISHMQWSDLSVATSGLTKYELAATGTPAVLISPDAVHVRANEAFLEIGSAADLGTIESISEAAVARIMCSLLDDHRRRSAMSRAGMRAVDGRGASRIAIALKELSGVET